MELERVDASVPSVACRYDFNPGHTFPIDDPSVNSKWSGPGIYTGEKVALHSGG